MFIYLSTIKDPARREEAELLFAKLKNCYEVLTDPHKRAIYDCLGKQGLQVPMVHWSTYLYALFLTSRE